MADFVALSFIERKNLSPPTKKIISFRVAALRSSKNRSENSPDMMSGEFFIA